MWIFTEMSMIYKIYRDHSYSFIEVKWLLRIIGYI